MKGSSSYVPRRLKQIMDRNNVNMNQLARATGISQQTISNYLRYESGIGLPTLITIADYFLIPIDYFLDRIDDDAAEKMLDGETKEFELTRKIAYEAYLESGRRQWAQHDNCLESPWPYNLIEAILNHRCETIYPAKVIDSFEEKMMSPDIRLHENTKKMLLEYYKDLKTLDDIAEAYHLTRERIRQRIKKGIRVLRSPMFSNFMLTEEEEARKTVETLAGEKEALLREINRLETEVKYWKAGSDTARTNVEERLESKDVYIDELDMSVRAYNCLRKQGCDSLFDIVKLAKTTGLLRIRNLGASTRYEIFELIKNKTGIDYSKEVC